MPNDASDLIEMPFAKAIAIAAEAANLPKSERMKLHRTNVQAVAFHEGVDGVARYKAEYPEAAPIRIKLNSLAYIPKPAGYDAKLVSLVDGWLSSQAARSSTNMADVERLNAHLGTNFPPGKHFSEPLSKGRLDKIKAVFASHDLSLDTQAVKTMSAVKAAAVAVKAVIAGERHLGRAGVISGDTLVINGRSFTVTRNGNRECIRVVIGGERQRVYLDQIEWLPDLLGDRRGSAPYSTMVHSMQNLPYPAQTPQNTPFGAPEILDPASGEIISLSDRITSIVAKTRRELARHSPPPEGIDPLAFDTDEEYAAACAAVTA